MWDKGLICKPKPELGLQVYVDADFAGNWNPAESWDRDTARSRHRYIVTFAGVPLVWKSQLQTEICLSSMESKYTGISYALREVIPLMELLKELKSHKYPIISSKADMLVEVFEDNSGAIEMSNNPKYRPRTKHINVKLHHFRDYIAGKEVVVKPVASADQLADYLTKLVGIDTLQRLPKQVMGW